MKQISADTCGRMQREGDDVGESELDQTNRGVNSTSRRMYENDRDGKSACMCVRRCVCKHSVTNQFSGHRSLEVENADAASYI